MTVSSLFSSSQLTSFFEVIIEQALFGATLFMVVMLVDRMISNSSYSRWKSFIWTTFFVFQTLPLRRFLESQQSILGAGPATVLRVDLSTPQKPAPEPIAANFEWLDIFPLLWIAGVGVFFFLGLILPMIKERKIKSLVLNEKNGDDTNLQGNLKKIVSLPLDHTSSVFYLQNNSSPFVAGLLKPAIYLPKNFDQLFTTEEQNVILSHEQAHILNRDLLKLFFSRFVISLFWFCPWLYYANFRLREAIESAADEKALRLSPNLKIKVYAETLLKVSQTFKGPSAISYGISIFNHSSLARRLLAMKYINRNKKISYLFPCLLALTIGFMSLTAVSVSNTVSDSSGNEKDKDIYTVKSEVLIEGKKVASPRVILQLGAPGTIILGGAKEEEDLIINLTVFKQESREIQLVSKICIGKNLEDMHKIFMKEYGKVCSQHYSYEVRTELDTPIRLNAPEGVELAFIVSKGTNLDPFDFSSVESSVEKLESN